MTWSSFHRRGEVLRAVIATAQSRRDGVLPRDVAGVAAVFADDLDLLGALQLTWHTRLMGRVESRQMHQPASLEAAVTRAWQDTYAQLDGVRLVLDAASQRVGMRLEQRARDGYAAGGGGCAGTPGPTYPSGVWERMVGRLRSSAA